jgi:16S rRNA (uracil1498-N3)-methyltransferase
VLSLRSARPAASWLSEVASGLQAGERPDWCFLSGPEGGLTPEEEDLALSCGWQAVSLGRRVLRADTAPLAVLSVIAAQLER